MTTAKRTIAARARAGLAVAAAALALLASACAVRTEMVTSWAAPGASKTSVKKVLVLGISQNDGLRRTFEDDFVAKLKSRGYEAVAGYNWIPDASKLDLDALAARMKQEGVTNLLCTRLVGTKTVSTYTPPAVYTSYGYAPYGPGWYGGWGPYWSVGYSTAVSPGYTTVNDVVTLETNFYDATKSKDAKDALMWSGQSQTWIDSGPDKSHIDSVIGVVVYEMRAKGVL